MIIEKHSPKKVLSNCKSNFVLILGGSGFLGREISCSFRAENIKHLSTSRHPESSDLIEFQLAQPGRLREILETFEVSLLINLIGNASSHSTRGLTLAERDQIFSHFDECKDLLSGKTRVLHIGSGAEYGNASRPYSEETHPSPNSAYGMGKLEETMYFQSLAAKGVEVAIVRPSVVFGAAQLGNMLVPSALRAISNSESFKVQDPHQVRDFLYVKDFASAILSLAKSGWGNQLLFNLGSGYPISVHHFLSKLADAYGTPVSLFGLEKAIPNQLNMIPEMNIDLFCKSFNWQPMYTLELALRDMKKLF